MWKKIATRERTIEFHKNHNEKHKLQIFSRGENRFWLHKNKNVILFVLKRFLLFFKIDLPINIVYTGIARYRIVAYF